MEQKINKNEQTEYNIGRIYFAVVYTISYLIYGIIGAAIGFLVNRSIKGVLIGTCIALMIRWIIFKIRVWIRRVLIDASKE